MAITDLPTFTVNGVLSSDYGIYVLRTNDEDFPERDYESVEIPNCTGNLIFDNGRWKNKNVIYNCVCLDSPSRNIPRFIGVFTKAGTNVRIEDTIHPDYMKLGKFKGGTTPKFKPYKTAATFDLVFDCDPRKWDIADATAGYDVWFDMTPGSLYTINAKQYFYMARHIAPRFRLRGITEVEFGKKTGDNSIEWKTIVSFNRVTTSVVLYDTETLHATIVSSGDSADYAVDYRYVPLIGESVCDTSNCDSFYFRTTVGDGATNPAARLNMRAYAL